MRRVFKPCVIVMSVTLFSLTLTSVDSASATPVTGASHNTTPDVTGGHPAMPQPPSAITAPSSVEPLTAQESAQAEAAATGHRVEVTSLRTEQTSTFANPDGTVTLETSASPVRLKRGGSWLAPDTSLVASSDGLAPRVTDVATSFSAGGDTVAATLTEGQSSLSLTWPTSLPAPSVSGDTATYPNVLPNVDLVQTATVRGMKQSLVLKKRPKGGFSARMPLRPAGLQIAQTPDGGLILKDSSGKPVFTSNGSMLYGATVDSRSGLPTREAPLDATLVETAQGPALDISATAAFLTDPTVTYPVTLDPPLSLMETAHTYVDSGFSTTSYYNSGEVRTGTYDSGSHVDRSMWAFPTSSLAGKTVQSATFSVDETWSWSCSARQVDLWDVGAFNSATTWANKPPLATLWSSVVAAKGYSSGCPAGALVFNATGMAQKWANSGASTSYAALKSASETDNYGWKKFDATSATVSVTLTSVPGAPASATAKPGDGTIGASWTAPTSNGGSAVTGYKVEYWRVGASAPALTRVLGNVLSDVPQAATNGDDYVVRVFAKNVNGYGPYRQSGAVTPARWSSAPQNLVVGGGNNRLQVSWTAPASDGGSPIDGYLIWVYPAGESFPIGNGLMLKQVSGTTRSTSMQAGDGSTCFAGCSPVNGNDYIVYVFPHNGATVGAVYNGTQLSTGHGPAALSGSVTAQSLPGTPATTVDPGDANVTISWQAPNNTGGPGVPLTSYVVFLYAPGQTFPSQPIAHAYPSASTFSHVFPGLQNGSTYLAHVWAVNASFDAVAFNGTQLGKGFGFPSSTTATPAGRPGVPGGVTADKGTSSSPNNDSFVVSWDSPSGNGATIKNYLVRTYVCAGSSASTCALAPTYPPVSVTPNGQSGRQHSPKLSRPHLGYYAFDVAADNTTAGNSSTGVGAYSTGSAPGQNYGLPLLEPSNVTATATGSRSVDVQFTPSVVDAAAYVITSYVVTGYTASDDVAQPRITATIPAGTMFSGDALNPYYKVTLTDVVNGVPVYWKVQASESVPILGTTVTFGTSTSAPSNTVTTSGAPFAPTDVVADTSDTGSGDAKVSWAAPPSRLVEPEDYATTQGDNGSAITSYTATSNPSPGTATTADGAARSVIVSSLKNGTSYTFVVAAANAKGTGAASAASNAVVPSWVPFAPGTPYAADTRPQDSRVNLAWMPPSQRADGTPGNNGATISSYVVTTTPAHVPPQSLATPSGAGDTGEQRLTIDGLSNGTSYTFQVHAVNAKGNGATSPPSPAILVAGPPNRPTNVQVTGLTTTSVTLNWTPSATNGTPVTSYLISVDPGGAEYHVDPSSACTAAVCSRTVTGLAVGRSYIFGVTADSLAGLSRTAEVNATTTPSAPNAPSNVWAIPADQGAKVSWTKPDARGNKVLHYTVEATPGGATTQVTTNSATITGLTNGTPYKFRVSATNSVGTSSYSDFSNEVTPAPPTFAGSSGTRAQLPPPADSPDFDVAALGDSYSSGEGNLPFEPGTEHSETGNGCDRSIEEAWPIKLRDLRFGDGTFDFVACSGAKTADVDSRAQHENDTTNGQRSILTDNQYDVITMTIGGNDVGFQPTLETCVKNGYTFRSCTQELEEVPAKIDAYFASNDLEELILEIMADAPRSDLVIETYPQIFQGTTEGKDSDDVDCYGSGRLSISDENIIRDLWTQMNDGIRATVADIVQERPDYRVTVVSVDDAFDDHQVCRPDSYVYGVHTGAGDDVRSYSFHPAPGGVKAQVDAANAALQPVTPEVVSVTPVPGTNNVRIYGRGFQGTSGTAVYFGGVQSQQATVDSEGQGYAYITASVPPGSPGTVDVIVQTKRGFTHRTSSATTSDQYTY